MPHGGSRFNQMFSNLLRSLATSAILAARTGVSVDVNAYGLPPLKHPDDARADGFHHVRARACANIRYQQRAVH